MHVFCKYWKRLLVKRLLVKNKKNKNTVNSKSTANVEDFISKKNSNWSSYQLQLEAYYVLLHPKQEIKFYTH